MDHQLICIWLGLPPDGSWPPDHYRLLGLPAGESDPATIERHVQQRLETVRRYQLTHPEQATEAMNRLAQAFVCLSDEESKRAYDATLLARPARRWVVVNPAGPARAALPEETPEATQVDLNVTAAGPSQAEVDTQIETPLPGPLPAVEPSPPPLAPPKSQDRVDPVVEAARSSAPARRGLGSKRALYRRLARTRQLLHAWEAAGEYMGNPQRRITRPSEALELIEELTTLRALLRGFPPLLGTAGQPGYLVIALARMQVIVPTFQTLLDSQREALARDWEAGQKLLIEHRDFLRQELRALRKRPLLCRAFRAVRSAITDQPGMVLLLLALLALNVALWRHIHTPSWLSIFKSKPPAESRP